MCLLGNIQKWEGSIVMGPNSWMVYLVENSSINDTEMDDLGVPPSSGNLHP
jgi:hypothetical protein